LQVTSRGITTISLAWDAPSDNGGRTIDYYIIQRSLSSSMSSPTQIQTSNLSATFSGLTGGTRYHFRVYAVTSAGNGSFSEIINATTFPAVAGEPYEVLARPTSVQFAWEPVSGATEYEWELLTSPTSGVVDTGTTSGTGPITVTGLTPRTSYYARVRVTQPEVGSYSTSTEIVTIIPMRGWGGTGWVHHLATYGWSGDGWVEADEVFGWDGTTWQPVQESA
jgi:titin